jgi:endonuclease/exonuclease/phosphatase family metal-dependent hydrolase
MLPGARGEKAPSPATIVTLLPAGRFSIASFNTHAGIDGWGRPFDVLAAVTGLDADVLVLQECWTPAAGPSLIDQWAAEFGYQVFWHPLASGRRARPHPRPSKHWMRRLAWLGTGHSLYLESERPLPERVTRSERYQQAEPGEWGLALLSRFPLRDRHVIDLGHLPKDRALRVALLSEIDLGPGSVTVVAAHMAHLTYGSPRHYRALARSLDAHVGAGPAVLAGDMNLWGPPVALLLRRWRRAVRGRTWPAWRPNSQVDHVLVRGPIAVERAGVLPDAGSDHRPVRVELLVEPGDPPSAGAPVAHH